MILGLDVSSTFTGYTVMDYNGKIVENGVIDLRKEKGLYNKATFIKFKFEEIRKAGHLIDAIYIEEPLMNFKYGRTSAATLSLLHRFNGMVSLYASDEFGVEPELINATKARGLVGIKVQHGENAKEKVLEHLTNTVPVFTFDKTRAGNPKPGTYDRADSWVIATAGLKLWQET